MFLSTNISVTTLATKPTLVYVSIFAKTTLTVITNLDKENKLNHMTDRMKGSVRLAAGRGNLRPLSLEVYEIWIDLYRNLRLHIGAFPTSKKNRSRPKGC